MKKSIFGTLAFAAALMVGCAEFDEPVSAVYTEAPGISVEKVSVADSTVTFKITIDTVNTTFFAYSFFEGDVDAPDSTLLLKKAAGGKAVLSKVGAKDSEIKDGVITKTYSKLMPDQDYSLYAVASSNMGMVGSVSGATAHTTDGLAPYLTAVKSNKNTLELTFSENVKAGKGAVTAQYLSILDYAKVYGADSLDIQIDGKNVAIQCLDTIVPAGAYVMISWETGAFVDAKGNACNAQTTVLDPATAEFTNNCYLRNDTVNFAIAKSNLVNADGSFLSASNIFELKFDMPIYEFDDESGLAPSLIIDAAGYTINLTDVDYEIKDSSLYIVSNKDLINYGSYVGVSIPAGFICDVNGNVNNAYSLAKVWLRSYGLDRSAVLGKWDVATYSYFEKKDTVMSMIITADPTSEDGVLIKGLLTPSSVITGSFDGDYAVLSINDAQLLFKNTTYAYIFYNADNDTDDELPVEFQYNPVTGKFSTETYFGYYASSLTGGKSDWYRVFCGAEAAMSADQSFGFAAKNLIGKYDMVYYSAAYKTMDTMVVSIDTVSATELVISDMYFKGSSVSAQFDAAKNQMVIEDWQLVKANYSAESAEYDLYLSTMDLTKVIFNICADATMIAYGSDSGKNILFGLGATAPGDDTAWKGWMDYCVGDVVFLHHEAAADGVQARVASRSNDTYYNVFSDVRKVKVSTLANPVLFHYNGK